MQAEKIHIKYQPIKFNKYKGAEAVDLSGGLIYYLAGLGPADSRFALTSMSGIFEWTSSKSFEPRRACRGPRCR